MAIPIRNVKGIGAHTAVVLAENGFKSADDLAAVSPETLIAVPGFGPARAVHIIKSAKAVVADATAQKTKKKKKKSSTNSKKKDKGRKEKKGKKDKKKQKKKKGKGKKADKKNK